MTADAAVVTRSRPAADAAILLEHVSVRYRVPHERISSFKEYAIRRIRRQVVFEDFWAVRDLSLEISPGEAMGIVGRNGAGKSTLLRVVARVISPTHGHVRVVGRVAPLLDIGAGFHIELTGRENVYLNATLLGHSHREIDAQFDAIIDFAELAEFVDAPLRTYSSGMRAKLGFSVATAWEPDVLIIDEVMAVGDESFRKKAQVRMDRFREHGASVLLVGHNLPAIASTCDRAIWLSHGHVAAAGRAPDVVREYVAHADET